MSRLADPKDQVRKEIVWGKNVPKVPASAIVDTSKFLGTLLEMERLAHDGWEWSQTTSAAGCPDCRTTRRSPSIIVRVECPVHRLRRQVEHAVYAGPEHQWVTIDDAQYKRVTGARRADQNTFPKDLGLPILILRPVVGARRTPDFDEVLVDEEDEYFTPLVWAELAVGMADVLDQWGVLASDRPLPRRTTSGATAKRREGLAVRWAEVVRRLLADDEARDAVWDGRVLGAVTGALGIAFALYPDVFGEAWARRGFDRVVASGVKSHDWRNRFLETFGPERWPGDMNEGDDEYA